MTEIDYERLRGLMMTACEAAGGRTELSRLLGLERSSTYHWKYIPAEHALAISRITEIPVTELRPDIFGTKADMEYQMDLIYGRTPVKQATHKRRRG